MTHPRLFPAAVAWMLLLAALGSPVGAQDVEPGEEEGWFEAEERLEEAESGMYAPGESGVYGQDRIGVPDDEADFSLSEGLYPEDEVGIYEQDDEGLFDGEEASCPEEFDGRCPDEARIFDLDGAAEVPVRDRGDMEREALAAEVGAEEAIPDVAYDGIDRDGDIAVDENAATYGAYDGQWSPYGLEGLREDPGFANEDDEGFFE